MLLPFCGRGSGIIYLINKVSVDKAFIEAEAFLEKHLDYYRLAIKY